MSFKQLLSVEHSLSYQTAAIMRRGLLCDQKETKRQIAAYDMGISEAKSRLREANIPSQVTTDEGRAALEAYFLKNNVEPEYTPKSGKLKVGADSLRMAAITARDDGATDAEKMVEDLIFVRQAEKIKTAYLYSFMNSARYDGRVHPAIRAMAARTHRMSISAPPLQQIPTHAMEFEIPVWLWMELQHQWDEMLTESFDSGIHKISLDTRGCLVADPGHVLVTADYSQIEQRVMATLAGEKKMIDAFRNGVDIHTSVASDMYGVSVDKVTPEQRQHAKNSGYAIIYGSGPKTLALTGKVTIPQAAKTLKLFKDTYPRVMSYAKSLMKQNEIVTAYGRVLPIDSVRKYAAPNYMVQSTARDLFVIGGMRIVNRGLGQYLWLPIHDEWILNVPIQYADRIAKLLGEIMTIDFFGTPIIAEGIVLGERWKKS